MKYGYYSATAVAQGSSTVWWSTPEGGEVEICTITLDASGDSFKWSDKEFRGEVVAFTRYGQPSTRLSKEFIERERELEREPKGYKRWNR